MYPDDKLTTAVMSALFVEEIGAAGGEVLDIEDSGFHLFARSVLPRAGEIGPSDHVQSGVAFRATLRDAWIHPFILRLVCRNGAILNLKLRTRDVVGLDTMSASDAASRVRESLRACCKPEVFTSAVETMRSASVAKADFVKTMRRLRSALADIPSRLVTPVHDEIVRRFLNEGDPSRLGLINSITSVARDAREPELRWRLEEFGGGVAVRDAWRPSPADARAEALMPA